MEIQTVRGMRDIIGKDALLEEKIEDTCKKNFKKYGFIPLYTPAVENFELFKVKGGAGEAIKEEIYYFKDKSDRELALRFEFTASLARVAATNQLKTPFKRYQIGEVYRYDRPQAKRYRAFTQADIDILGIPGLEAELELMQIVGDIFSELGLAPSVDFNSRKLMQEIIGYYAKGKEVEAMRLLDKIDKVGETEVEGELEKIGVNKAIVGIIRENDIAKITQIVGQASAGLEEVVKFNNLCKENKLDFVKFNASLARGLEYYTGIVFEAKIENGPSIAGGGRFDKLVGLYGGNETPAVGISFGCSRIFDYLKEKNEEGKINGIFLFGVGIPSTKVMELAKKLRSAEIICETDLLSRSISKNIEYAEKKGFRCVGILGENELAKGEVTIKNLINGMQFSIEMDPEKIRSIMNNKEIYKQKNQKVEE